MMLRQFTAAAVLAVTPLLFLSCANQPDVTPIEAAAARSFTPPEGKALLCVYRTPGEQGTLVGKFGPLPVFVNDQHLSSNEASTFMVIPLPPGKYTIQAGAPGALKGPRFQAIWPDQHVTLAARQTVFIRQKVHRTGENETIQVPGDSEPIVLDRTPLFKASVVDRKTALAEMAGMKQVGADPLEENP